MGKPKPRPSRDLRAEYERQYGGTWAPRELLSGAPEQRRVPFGQSAPEHLPRGLLGALRFAAQAKGTNLEENLYRFIPHDTIVDYSDFPSGFEYDDESDRVTVGYVRHDDPKRVRVRGGTVANTTAHEAAHSRSLRARDQLYSFGERLHPSDGGEEVIRRAAEYLARTNDFDPGDYGGAEEQAARLAAYYAMQPAGTPFADTFRSTFTEPYTITHRRDPRPKDERGILGNVFRYKNVQNIDDADAHLNMLERALWPGEDFVDEAPPPPPESAISSGLSALRDMATRAKRVVTDPVESWYTAAINRRNPPK
jgi:hypothetical protein